MILHTNFKQLQPIIWKWSDVSPTGKHSIYHDAAYQKLFADYDGSDAYLLEGTAGAKKIYLPLLVKELGEGLKEAYSAYGYGGFLGGLSLSEGDLNAMVHFLEAQSIVAIFVRHTPFLNNQNHLPLRCIELNRHTYVVVLQLRDSFSSYVKELSQKVRWSVNFALRSGLSVVFHSLSDCSDDRVRAFYKLYAALMNKKQTSNYYLFSEQFFLEHAYKLGARCELAEVVDSKSGELLAGAFFLLDDSGWVHYHLSAARSESMKLQVMELLIASAIFRYGQQGYKFMHLGGGHSLDECDGLSRFKSKFSNERLDFFSTKIVCNNAEYDRERKRMPLVNPAFFLVSDARQR